VLSSETSTWAGFSIFEGQKLSDPHYRSAQSITSPAESLAKVVITTLGSLVDAFATYNGI
jgi:hypothetical protein